jgi:hypothetical protein
MIICTVIICDEDIKPDEDDALTSKLNVWLLHVLLIAVWKKIKSLLIEKAFRDYGMSYIVWVFQVYCLLSSLHFTGEIRIICVFWQ